MKRKRAIHEQQRPGDSDHEPGRRPTPSQEVLHGEAAVELPPRGVQRDLLDVYFSYTFNSTLVFDRTSAERDWTDGRLSEPVVLAICGMATVYAFLPYLPTCLSMHVLIGPRFLHPSSVLIQQNRSILGELDEDYKTLSRQWALQAGGLVLPKVDQPTLEIVQVCQVLGLFWFAIGEVQRHSMFTGPI